MVYILVVEDGGAILYHDEMRSIDIVPLFPLIREWLPFMVRQNYLWME